jgi:hypothetical protein
LLVAERFAAALAVKKATGRGDKNEPLAEEAS